MIINAITLSKSLFSLIDSISLINFLVSIVIPEVLELQSNLCKIISPEMPIWLQQNLIVCVISSRIITWCHPYVYIQTCVQCRLVPVCIVLFPKALFSSRTNDSIIIVYLIYILLWYTTFEEEMLITCTSTVLIGLQSLNILFIVHKYIIFTCVMYIVWSLLSCVY